MDPFQEGHHAHLMVSSHSSMYSGSGWSVTSSLWHLAKTRSRLESSCSNDRFLWNWLYNLWVSQWAWICVQVYLSSFLVCSWCLHQTWYRRCLRNAASSIAFFSLHHAVCLCTSLKIRHNKIWACSINKLWFWKLEKDLLLRNVICGWWDMMRSNCTFLSIRILRKRYLIRSGPNMKPGSS